MVDPGQFRQRPLQQHEIGQKSIVIGLQAPVGLRGQLGEAMGRPQSSPIALKGFLLSWTDGSLVQLLPLKLQKIRSLRDLLNMYIEFFFLLPGSHPLSSCRSILLLQFQQSTERI